MIWRFYSDNSGKREHLAVSLLTGTLLFSGSWLGCATLSSWSSLPARASGLSGHQMNDKEAAKNSNVYEAKKLNGDLPQDEKSSAKSSKQSGAEKNKQTNKSDKLGGESSLSDEKNKKDAKKTADAVNQVPGVKVKKQDLEPPTAKPIKGFHPIKKMLRPIENLEGMSIKLEQQIMKLEGPIASLQPPMISLQKKMTRVDGHIGSMQGQLDGMQKQVTGVRGDIADMRKDIKALKEPIVALKEPIGTVAQPLEKLQRQLNFIILAIFVASIAIAVGTPVAAVLLYKHRNKFFPELKELDANAQKAAQRPEPAGRR